MFYVKQSESTAARRRVPILMVDATDGSTPETGLTLYGLLSKNGNNFAATAGTFAEAGYGQYYYQFDTGEIDTLGFAGIHVTATGARNYDAIIHVTAYDAYVGSFISPTDVWNADISSITTAGTAGSQLNLVASGGAGITSGDVWNYDISGITGAGTAGSQVNAAASGGAGITAGDVWEYDISAISTAGSAGTQLNVAAVGGGGSLTAADVWDYSGLTVAASVKETLETASTQAGNAAGNTGSSTIRDAVWDTDLSYLVPSTQAAGWLYSASVGATTAAEQVWNYDISAISGAGLAGTQLNIAAAPGAGGGITAGDVWTYVIPGPSDAAETVLANINQNVGNLPSAETIKDYVWNAQLDESAGFSTSPPYASGLMYQAGNAITTVPSDVWNYDISAISGAGLAGTQLNLAAAPSGAGITAGDVSNAVWDVPVASYTTNGTFGLNILRSDIAGVAGTVTLWTGGSYSGIYADTYRIDASYDAAIALKDILTGIGASITGNITGDLSGSVGSVTADVNVSTASMSGIANTVWSTDISGYTSPSAGYDLANASSGAGITAGDVWDFNITGFGGTNSAAVYVTDTNFNVGNIQTYVSTQTPQDVWSYAGIEGRTITGGIADTVTTVVNGVTVTTNNDKTGYALSGTQSFNLTGNITGNLSGSVGSVTSDVPVNEASISADVWGYVSRTLTSGAGISAGDVWSYATRTVTGGAIDNATVSSIGASALTSIADKVWRYQVVGFVPPYNSSEAGYVVGNIGNEIWSWDINQSAGAPDSAADYLLAAASGTTSNAPAQVWSYATRTITGGTANTVTNAVLVDPASMSGIANTVWSVDVSGYTSPSAGYDLSNATAGGGITAGDVWQYATRTITGGIADTVTTVTNGVTVTTNNDKTGYSLSGTQSFNLTGNITGDLSGSVGYIVDDVTLSAGTQASIANSVWSTDISGYTSPSAGYDLSNASSGAGISAYDVWNFDPTAMTVPAAGAILTDIQTDTNQIQTDISNVPNNVWSSDVSGYSTPGEAGFELSQAAAGSGLTAGDVWNYSGSYAPGTSGDALNTAATDSAIAAAGVTSNAPIEVWSYVTRTLTSGGGVTAGDVWSYATRTTTGGVVDTNNDKTGYSLSSTQTFDVTGNITGNISGSVGSVTNPVDITTNAMSGTAGSVWNYVTRTLTSGSGLTAGDVWSYVLSNTDTAEANLVTAASGGAGITAGDVWTYATREITGGVIDTNNDKTDYALSTAGVNAVQSGLSTVTTAQVGQEVDASLLDVGLTSVVTGRIDAAVSSRLATSSYVTPPTTAAIATSVWTAATRTLTSGAGATAGDVWTYNIAGITSSGSAGAQLNDASVSGSVVTVVNGPYRLTSIAEGVDGRIDILADSVQTIQLNCLDGFGAPFNITGYTSLVNVYDVSGALAETYTPTVDFSQNGIISFDIDTVITGTTGRYTSVVELTAGADVIQLGPLEILVRPL
jgi:hypothetical protein